MAYNHQEIDNKWQNYWEEEDVYKVDIDETKPKYYVLDMFPYPSGSGLHVGHPLGYVASDIYARYKRLKGFNVLHPIGFDSFGLPAEQYAIETGVHPAKSTEKNVQTFKRQLSNIGLSFDWSREINTSHPKYYKWTQWIFMQLFNHFFCTKAHKAKPIEALVAYFEEHGNIDVNAFTDSKETFTAEDWKNFSAKEKSDALMHYRLAYRKTGFVNWCEELGTVLANDEVINGFSERGGHPVIQKPLVQWSLRITAYADRLLNGLEDIDWSESIKIQQENWIGKSEGASVQFNIDGSNETIEVYTTRPDTIFGTTFIVLAPEHEMVDKVTTPKFKDFVSAYKSEAKKKTAIDRKATKLVSGEFTGAYAIHPFTGKLLPIWISDYVLIEYGTGAIMAVPSDDDRDAAFADKFGLDIINICDKSAYPKAAKGDKVGTLIHSDFLNGLSVKEAIHEAVKQIDENGYGKAKVNYRLRDANFSRQRYWGEPFPIVYDENQVPHLIPESELPLLLPEMEDIEPKNGKSPLSKLDNWTYNGMPLDTDTMPGNAGSSWYFLRYMDPTNDDAFCSEKALSYWQDVDLYLGGTEHAVGHLMYSRFWHKFLYDLGYVKTDEPFKKLINQGMIQGESAIIYKLIDENTYVSFGLKDDYETVMKHVDVNLINEHDELDIEGLKKWRNDYKDARFILEGSSYIVGHEIEKMSKSKHNVVNPDDVIAKYGADCFRMFEMFLGPIESHKPWQTKGIDGVSKFLRKLWSLFHDDTDNLILEDSKPSEKDMKILHTCIKKVNEDLERFSLNTCVSAFMICVNELSDTDCHNKSILEELTKLISPFAPHIAEELWRKLGHETSVVRDVTYPVFQEKYLMESVINYPVSINGKMRVKIDLDANISQEDAKSLVLANEIVQKWVGDKPVKKFIFVPKRIVNIVV